MPLIPSAPSYNTTTLHAALTVIQPRPRQKSPKSAAPVICQKYPDTDYNSSSAPETNTHTFPAPPQCRHVKPSRSSDKWLICSALIFSSMDRISPFPERSGRNLIY